MYPPPPPPPPLLLPLLLLATTAEELWSAVGPVPQEGEPPRWKSPIVCRFWPFRS